MLAEDTEVRETESRVLTPQPTLLSYKLFFWVKGMLPDIGVSMDGPVIAVSCCSHN